MVNGAQSSSERGRAQLARIVGAKLIEAAQQPSADGDEIDGAELLGLDMPEAQYLCRPWIPEGVMIFAGRPKLGKTTLLRQFAACVAAGRDLWGAACSPSDVLFLSLEEGAKLMRKKLVLAGYVPDEVRRILFHFNWRPGVFGVGDIRAKLGANPGIRLVIIDSLTRFRDTSTRDKPQFQLDYEAVAMLADVAKERPGLSIVVLHHTKKEASADDPISDISGTYGLTAAADNYMVMRREGADFVLHAGGRFWDESDDAFRLRRDAGRWALEGAADAARLSPMQRQFLDLLRAEGTITTRGMARRIGRSDSTCSELFGELQGKGLAERTADGWRAVPTTHPKTSEVVGRAERPETSERGELRSFGSFGVSGDGASR